LEKIDILRKERSKEKSNGMESKKEKERGE
jgi:hypothetical protein